MNRNVWSVVIRHRAEWIRSGVPDESVARLVFLHGGGDGIDALQDDLGGRGIRHLEAEVLVQSHDQLQSIHGIKTETAGAE